MQRNTDYLMFLRVTKVSLKKAIVTLIGNI